MELERTSWVMEGCCTGEVGPTIRSWKMEATGVGQELKEEERRYSESQLPLPREWMMAIHLMLLCALRDLVMRVSTSTLWGPGQFPAREHGSASAANLRPNVPPTQLSST